MTKPPRDEDDEPERPATIELWVACRHCGRFHLDPADFMAPIDIEASGAPDEIYVAIPCPRCDEWAQLYMRRVLKPLQ